MALDESRRDWQERIARCRELADLMRGDTAGARLAALAREIEQQLQTWSELRAVADEQRRHRRAMLAEIDVMVIRTRLELSLSRLRAKEANGSEQLREEARLCREEALAGDDMAMRRSFAGRAFELSMMGEALLRKADE